MASPLLKLTDVAKRFVSPAGVETEVLRGVTLEVATAESLAVVGPSGSGKSTLLNIMGTLDRPSSGAVEFAGLDVSGLDETGLSSIRGRRIGFVFQQHHLLPQCDIVENVLVPTLVSGHKDNALDRARRLLDRVGLSHRLHYRPGQLSGGECQRVAVVRALINKPDLLLADEPTGSLDRVQADNLARILLELNHEEQTAVILVTHSPTLASRMGKVYELRDGRLHSTA